MHARFLVALVMLPVAIFTSVVDAGDDEGSVATPPTPVQATDESAWESTPPTAALQQVDEQRPSSNTLGNSLPQFEAVVDSSGNVTLNNDVQAPPLGESGLPNDTAAIMREIMSIRRMFGDLLEGTTVQASVIGGQAAANNDDPEQTPDAQAAFAKELRRAIVANAVQRHLDEPREEEFATPANEKEQTVARLRHMSRELDERAEHFEQTGQYTQADQLRNLAQQIRVQARSFDQPQVTAAPYTSSPRNYQSNGAIAPSLANPQGSTSPLPPPINAPAASWQSNTPPQRIAPTH